MQRINVLLAGADRPTANVLAAAILDVCYEQAVADITRTARIDELIHFGCREQVAVIVVLADHLVVEPSRGGVVATEDEVRKAMTIIRGQRTTPILAVTMAPENESALLEVGADYVCVGRPDPAQIKTELKTWLKLADPGETAAPERGSLSAWIRGYFRLRSA